MNEKVDRARASGRQDRSLGTLARRLREVMARGDLESENHRKAALRSLLHEHAAGLTREEIEDLVADLRGRFPDRIFESVSSARGLASRSAELEEDVGRLREERDRLRRQVDHLESLMGRLALAAGSPKGQPRGTVGGSLARRALPPETEEALTEVAALLFSFAIHQEETARSVEETLGVQSSAPAPTSLTVLLPRLSKGEPLDPGDLEAIGQRLRSLQLLPGALMAGAQQSWRGGTREILEHLDPKTAEKNVSGVLKFQAVLKEVRLRFDQFWSQFDRNIEHYYRGRFERAYRDKMEDNP